MRLVQRDDQPVQPPSGLAQGPGVDAVCESIGDHLRTALGYAVGLWPLTCVVLLLPFFGVRELARVIGRERMRALLFEQRVSPSILAS